MKLALQDTVFQVTVYCVPGKWLQSRTKLTMDIGLLTEQRNEISIPIFSSLGVLKILNREQLKAIRLTSVVFGRKRI